MHISTFLYIFFSFYYFDLLVVLFLKSDFYIQGMLIFIFIILGKRSIFRTYH